jgi:membrane associated rhomboid family serine protease
MGHSAIVPHNANLAWKAAMFIAIPTEIDDSRSPHDIPIANAIIIALNVAAFFLGIRTPVGPGTDSFSIVVYGFSHATITHLFVNMWVLLVVGNAVNRRIGNGFYALCYFGTLTTLGLFARLFAGQYLVGSSGAIFAVIAVATMLLPAAWAKIACIALFPITLLIGLLMRPKHWLYWLVRWDTVRLRAVWLIVLVPVMEMAGLFWSGWNWTNLAHLFGFVCGVVFTGLLPSKVSMGRYSAAY